MRRDRVFLGFWLLALGACTAREPDLSTETSLPASEPSVAAVEASSPGTPAWPVAGHCGDLVQRLAQLDETVLAELTPAEAPIAVAATGDSSTRLSQRLNLPQAEPAKATARCTIVLGEVQALPAAADRVLDRRIVHSAYPTGIKRRRNPDHQQLEKALTAARRGGGDDFDVAATGDPFMDLIGAVAGGMIGGIDAVWQKRQIRTIESELAATPAFIEDEIRTPYRFQVTDIAAERRIALPVALHDAVTEEAWATSLTLSERRRFAVAEDRHASDTTPVQAAGATLVTPVELANWRAAEPPLQVRELLIHLAAAQRDGDARQATLAATIAGLRAGDPAASTRLAWTDTAAPPAATPARSAGLPRTSTDPAPIGHAGTEAAPHPPEPAAGPGQAADGSAATRRASLELLEVGAPPMPGFYVSSEHILAPAAALGRSSLVAIRHPDGMRSHGMTEIVDDELGLAIVFVPRRGEAAPIRGSRSDAPAAAGPSGVPWTRDAEIVGLFVAGDERSRWIDGATLERLIDRLDSL